MTKDPAPAYGPGIPHFGLPKDCPCSCCAEAKNRYLHGRDMDGWAACSCSDHSPDQRCECPFCLDMVKVVAKA